MRVVEADRDGLFDADGVVVALSELVDVADREAVWVRDDVDEGLSDSLSVLVVVGDKDND